MLKVPFFARRRRKCTSAVFVISDTDACVTAESLFRELSMALEHVEHVMPPIEACTIAALSKSHWRERYYADRAPRQTHHRNPQAAVASCKS